MFIIDYNDYEAIIMTYLITELIYQFRLFNS